MSKLEIITALNALLNLAIEAGINIQKLNAIRARAKAEGRQITVAELQELSDAAQAAIDRLAD